MDNKKPIYKKWWVWVGIIVLVFIIVSTANNSQPEKVGENTGNINSNKNSQQEIKKEIAKPKIFKIGDQVKLGDYILTVNEASKCVATNPFMSPESGNKFISVDITQENTGTEPRDYNIWYFKLQDNESFTYSTAMATCKEPSFGSGTLQNTQKTRGHITFEIPEVNTATKLIFTPSWWTSGQIIIDLQ